MSYRKKRSSSRAEPPGQQAPIPEVKYANPGVSRDLSTAKLTSGPTSGLWRRRMWTS